MFCCNCGVRNPDDANYCHKCGNPLCRDDADEGPHFVPYEVSIRPNFYTILTDFDLVKDTRDAWDVLGSRIRKVPKGPWNIWGGIGEPGIDVGNANPYGGGFSFSFISPQVIYKPAWNSFASEVRIPASLEPVGVRRELLRDETGEQALFEEYYPSLHLRSGGGGYKLTIELPESYWETVRQKDAFKEIADEDVPRHTLQGELETWSPAVEVPLAVVPYEEFEAQFTAGASPSRYQLPIAMRYAKGASGEALERRTKARARHGWKGESRVDGREMASEHSDFAEHRYLLVSYWAL